MPPFKPPLSEPPGCCATPDSIRGGIVHKIGSSSYPDPYPGGFNGTIMFSFEFRMPAGSNIGTMPNPCRVLLPKIYTAPSVSFANITSGQHEVLLMTSYGDLTVSGVPNDGVGKLVIVTLNTELDILPGDIDGLRVRVEVQDLFGSPIASNETVFSIGGSYGPEGLGKVSDIIFGNPAFATVDIRLRNLTLFVYAFDACSFWPCNEGVGCQCAAIACSGGASWGVLEGSCLPPDPVQWGVFGP